MKFVGVTSCPTGIAHSEMAAEAIEVAAKKQGHEIEMEVQGASGAPPIDSELIKNADAVIFAIDADVRDRGRFSHLPKVEVGTRHAIDKADEVVKRAVTAAEEGTKEQPADAGSGDGGEDAQTQSSDSGGRGAGAEVRRWLMTGVSYMIPFVVAGGILIAAAFAVGDAVTVTDSNVYENFTIPAMLFEIGGQAFSMLVPILAGFIAYSMADRPAIAPGLVGGLIANAIGAGFLGGILAGLLAGGLVIAMKKIPAKGAIKRIMPILVYPVVGTLVVGALMILVIGEPAAALTSGLESWLQGLQGTGSIILGLIIGMMMAFDMGGPINKAAYAFGLAALEAQSYAPMAAVMAAGMVPPLAMALSTRIRPKLYTENERQAGDAGWLMGASFITEGAIPFAAADPIRVIPPMMAGSAVAAVMSLLFNATLRAPHGGIWVIALIGNWPLYLLAIVSGTLVAAALVTVTKSVGRGDEPTGDDEKADAQTAAA